MRIFELGRFLNDYIPRSYAVHRRRAVLEDWLAASVARALKEIDVLAAFPSMIEHLLAVNLYYQLSLKG